jgi:hydroxymethylpyrimidine/phosphomethylpyrimidine kinase
VFAAHGLFGTSAITALTVQSTRGISGLKPVSATLFREVLNHLCADLPPHGVKIGMLCNTHLAFATARYLKAKHKVFPSKRMIPCVLDPVLVSSSGTPLLTSSGLNTLHEHLLPVVDWITPNWPELAVLSGHPVASLAQAASAATSLGDRYPHLNMVVTGGDQTRPTDLLRLPNGDLHRFEGDHIETTSTHGTGCAFSSALLSRIILGSDPVSAVSEAKHYVTEAIRTAPTLGHGRGPLNLLWPIQNQPHKSGAHSLP